MKKKLNQQLMQLGLFNPTTYRKIGKRASYLYIHILVELSQSLERYCNMLYVIITPLDIMYIQFERLF
jgi:hypothetical protein